MEIKNLNSNMIKAYKSVANTKTAKEDAAGSVKQGGDNVDKLEFDISASLAAAKSNVASGIDAETNTAKIEQLQAAYAGDNCPVSAEQIAGALLNF